jgi:dTDP-4-amino-4,6-dideoxygalactose transaminase
VITFNRPYLTGKELHYIRQAHRRAQLAGDGHFTEKCHRWLESHLGTKKALLTHSCTSALEMAAILAEIRPGDEVIMPSFTFVSTANAFVLRGAVPVFVDIRPDTLNLDETLVEKAITKKTRAIVPVHYAGVGCEMKAILAVARHHGLLVIEDAAHCLGATYRGRELGTFGDFGALSFHETKNIISGEGGALLINSPDYLERAEVVWQKGTNRRAFQNKKASKYTWVDIGSSFLPGEITAAFLWAQLQSSRTINTKRKMLWNRYFDLFADLEKAGKVRRPVVPRQSAHNAHMFYLLLPTPSVRHQVIQQLRRVGIQAVFHYVPLHSSPAGRIWGRSPGKLPVTEKVSETILRLPFWVGLRHRTQIKILKIITSLLG